MLFSKNGLGLLLFCLLLVPSFPTQYAHADGEVDDAYDPFADYSEFDAGADEEEDVHFFRNGRFFTVGLVGGLRNWTDNLNSLYSAGPTYGVYMSYFFDLNLALQFGFLTGDYDFYLNVNDTNKDLRGTVSHTMMGFDFKYYFNTQNVTRGLANINPYILGGFSQIYRTYSIETGTENFTRDTTVGVDLGAGIEIPMFRRKSYFGFQGTYRYFTFKDESRFLVDKTGAQTTAVPRGDSFDVLAIIGLNF